MRKEFNFTIRFMKGCVIELFRRILLQIVKEEEVEHLVRYAKVLKEKYPKVEITGIYIKDLEKYDIPTTSLYGEFLSIDSTDQWNKLENERAEKIRSKFFELMPGSEFLTKLGHASVIVLNELRLFDMLVLAKPERLTHEIKEVLRTHHKPIIMVPPADNYGFDKILVADDQRLEVNKALFNFMDLFVNIKEFKAITVNPDEDETLDLNTYLTKVGKKIEHEYKTGQVNEIVMKYSDDYDLVILGDLKYSFMIERIAGKVGIKLLEALKKPIFIA